MVGKISNGIWKKVFLNRSRGEGNWGNYRTADRRNADHAGGVHSAGFLSVACGHIFGALAGTLAAMIAISMILADTGNRRYAGFHRPKQSGSFY